MPTWNCKKCNLPLTTQDPGNLMKCPHCKKFMFQVEWLDSALPVFQWSRWFFTIIETSMILDNSNHLRLNWYTLTDCKEGYVNNFSWFEIQQKRMCIHCLIEEWFQVFISIFYPDVILFKINKLLITFFIMTCKGICHRYKAIKPNHPNTRYGTGQKRCNRCELFLNWDGVHCPCCGISLRTKPRAMRSKQNLMIIRNVERFWNWWSMASSV